MGRYLCGPSVLRLAGHAAATRPGQIVEHDFSATGPEGEHGPAREAALLASRALQLPPDTETELDRTAASDDLTSGALLPADAPAPAVDTPAAGPSSTDTEKPRGGSRRRVQE